MKTNHYKKASQELEQTTAYFRRNSADPVIRLSQKCIDMWEETSWRSTNYITHIGIPYLTFQGIMKKLS